MWAYQVKNVSTTMLEGKVGRMYLPQQGVDKIALHKMKVCCWPTLLGPCLHACTGPDLGMYSMASNSPKLVGHRVCQPGVPALTLRHTSVPCLWQA